MDIQEISNQTTWDNFIKSHGGHPLQLWGWGETKSSHGWRSKRVFLKKHNEVVAAAQILVRPVSKPFNSLCYVPRGPVISRERYTKEVFENLSVFCKKQKSVELKVESDQLKSSFRLPKTAKLSKTNILLSHTAQIDLSRPEEEIRADFSKKTRQYINKSKKQVEIRELSPSSPENIKKILKIYKETANRANFALHDDNYYQNIAKFLGENNKIFAAYEKNPEEKHQEPDDSAKPADPVAFLWLAATPEIAFELYGGMTEVGASLRANYALKDFAIFTLKNQKIHIYDLNGLLNDGVSNFKRGFVSAETQLFPVFDIPLSPLYPAFALFLPSMKKLAQNIKKVQKSVFKNS